MGLLRSINQFVMAQAMSLVPYRHEVLRGPGSLKILPHVMMKNSIHHILLMTTPGMISRGNLDTFISACQSFGLQVTTFTDIQPNPTDVNVYDAAQCFVDNDCDAIIAVGGGSVIDCAKMAGTISGDTSMRLASDDFEFLDVPFLVAVPTTAGSGSETTAGAVITVTLDNADQPLAEHVKRPFSSLKLVPNIIILDATLTLSLPASVTLASGMDAISHAFEAGTNLYASAKTRNAVNTALPLLCTNLPRVIAQPRDIQSRQSMLEGAYWAGVAITTNYVGNVHSLSHAIASLYDIPHGMINAALLIPVLTRYGHAIDRSLTQCARALSMPRPSAQACLAYMDNLLTKLDVPRTLPELRPEDYDHIIVQAMAETGDTYPVPARWQEYDYRAILEAVTA